jgi:hypothetical protein
MAHLLGSGSLVQARGGNSQPDGKGVMARIARRVSDKRVLSLVRRYLQACMMQGVSVRREGTPQGGPLSPLPSNILLDEPDKELERQGGSEGAFSTG